MSCRKKYGEYWYEHIFWQTSTWRRYGLPQYISLYETKGRDRQNTEIWRSYKYDNIYIPRACLLHGFDASILLIDLKKKYWISFIFYNIYNHIHQILTSEEYYCWIQVIQKVNVHDDIFVGNKIVDTVF